MMSLEQKKAYLGVYRLYIGHMKHNLHDTSVTKYEIGIKYNAIFYN